MLKKKGIDIVDKVLEACYAADKEALFIMSLMHQYEDRGFLTKKQLQGLHSKAQKIKDISPGWLATLETMITKLPTRDKTPVDISKITVAVPENKATLSMLEDILAKYPQHKTVLMLKAKFKKDYLLVPADMAELEKFHKLLVK